MANQVLVKFPHEALKTVSAPFTAEEFEAGLPAQLERDLVDTLVSAGPNGVALAANQIAVCKRMFISRDPANHKSFMTFVNPEIVKQSKPTVHKEEGCLSLSQRQLYNVPRYNRVVVKFQDVKGNHKKLQFRGFMAFVMQHEIDHLNGNLINDFDERNTEQTAANLDLDESRPQTSVGDNQPVGG